MDGGVMAKKTDMICAYCGKRCTYPDDFPVRVEAKCLRWHVTQGKHPHGHPDYLIPLLVGVLLAGVGILVFLGWGG